MLRQAFFFLLALLASSALLTAAPAAAQNAAQNAETFFHSAAQSYIGKDLPEAKRQVEAGLNVAPSDPKLLALREKLEQQEQQQSQQSGQDQSQTQKGQQGQQDNKQKGEQQDDQQEEGDQEGEQQEGKQPPEDPQEGEQENDASEVQPGEVQPPPDPSTLTEAQAERILQALQNQEKQLLREVQRGRPVRGRPTDKDW